MPRLGTFAAEVSPCAFWVVQRWRDQLERVSICGSLPVGLELNQEARILLRLSTPLQAPEALGQLALFTQATCAEVEGKWRSWDTNWHS